MNKSGRNFTKDEKKNKKRIEILEVLKKNNVKIIFVVTHFENKNSRWQKHGTFINYLKEYGLKDLIENDESNIIKCNLVGENAYGVKEIFKKIYSYLNLIEDNEQKQTEEVYTESLIEEIKKDLLLMKNLLILKQKLIYLMNFNQKMIY